MHNFKERLLNDEDIKKLAILWRQKKETPSELIKLANILFSFSKQIELDTEAIDICGTGGDMLNTFNVSTLAAIVASSCGIKVIKHSGRSTTSVLGSVDILNKIEINLDSKYNEECFRKYNLMFVSSKILRELFSDVKRVCKKNKISCFVNLLGPLTNPYKTSFHLLGVSKIEWGELMSSALSLQEKKEVLVVCSKINENMYLDEFSLCGTNYIWLVKNGEIKKEILEAKDLNESIMQVDDLIIKNSDEGVSVFFNILKGNYFKEKIMNKAKFVAINTGAALYLSKKASSFSDGYRIALQHLQSGKVWEHFQNFTNCIRET